MKMPEWAYIIWLSFLTAGVIITQLDLNNVHEKLDRIEDDE